MESLKSIVKKKNNGQLKMCILSHLFTEDPINYSSERKEETRNEQIS